MGKNRPLPPPSATRQNSDILQLMPKEARVYSVEDNQEHRLRIKVALEAAGHTLVGYADNEDDAILAFDSFGQLGVQVVTIDDYIVGGKGKVVALALRKRFPDIKILALASGPSRVVVYDRALLKDNIEDWLGTIVTEL